MATPAIRAMNDARDGMLVVPPDSVIEDLRNPSVEGSDVGRHLGRSITMWSRHAGDPLFRKDQMDIGDINQECVGDCWYLAALVSIMHLTNGSNLLKKTMVDIGGGRCIVRLFDGELRPHYLRVEKSVLWFLGSGKVHVTGITRTGLWAAVLEKAACAMTQSATVCDPRNANYKNIEGGESHNAFRMLLGVRAQPLGYPNANLSGGTVGRVSAGDHISQLFATGNWNRAITDRAIVKTNRDALFAIFGMSVGVEQWREYLNDLRARRCAFLNRDLGTILEGLLAPAGTTLPPAVQAALRAYIQTHNMLSGATGSGRYGAGAMDLFNAVRARSVSNCPVALGTKQDIGPVDGFGHSAGEKKSAGMVGKHAYAVLGTFEETVGPRRKWIKVSNPWNRFGRGYTEGANLALTPQEQECGTFWMELADLGNVVNSVYVAENPGR